jgi:hypothetical protein
MGSRQRVTVRGALRVTRTSYILEESDVHRA